MKVVELNAEYAMGKVNMLPTELAKVNNEGSKENELNSYDWIGSETKAEI